MTVQSQQLAALLFGLVQVAASRQCCEQSRQPQQGGCNWVMEFDLKTSDKPESAPTLIIIKPTQ